jgi:MoxR-like ATPase
LQAVVTPDQLAAASAAVRTLHLDPKVRNYILDLVAASREPDRFGLAELAPLIDHGASPRGSICLARAARAQAFLRRRPYVVPDDVVTVAPAVLRHRLLLSFEADARGIAADDLVARILAAVPRP